MRIASLPCGLACGMLFATGNTLAQSIIIPDVQAVQGHTAIVDLAFVRGGNTTNIDFIMSYDDTVIDETGATIDCSNSLPELDSFNCSIDTVNNQFKGIGINLSGSLLSSSTLARVSLPVFSSAPSGDSISDIAENFAVESGVAKPLATTWRLTIPGESDRPTGVKATDGTFSDKVRVTFNTVAGATVYRVFRCMTSGQTCGSPIGFPKTGVFDDTRGIPGTVYYYRVRACNTTTCGKFSAANTGFSSVALARPTGIKATDGTFSDKVRVTFNTVAGATVYRVFRCMTSGQTCGSPIGFPKTGVFDDTRGIPGTVYYYRVRACNTTTCGKFSTANTGFSSVTPARPTGIRASDGSYPKRVRVTWNKVIGTTIYRIFRCSTKGPDCGSPVGFPKNPVFDDFKGKTGVVYYYRIRACNANGCSAFSVADAGHRGTVPSTEANARIDVAVPIPILDSQLSRWLLILMTLGTGLLLFKRQHTQRGWQHRS